MRIVICLLVAYLPLAAETAAVDLSGLWVGSYEISVDDEPIAVGVSVVFEHDVDQVPVQGRLVEEFKVGRGIEDARSAQIAGILGEDGVLRFEKRYLADDLGAALVRFELELSPNGDVLTGTWRMGDHADKRGLCVLARLTAADRREFIRFKRGDGD